MALYAEAAVYSDNVDMIDREEILEKFGKYWTSCRKNAGRCLLRFVHGYKYSEISEQLRMNENTVKVQLHLWDGQVETLFADYDFALILFVWRLVLNICRLIPVNEFTCGEVCLRIYPLALIFIINQ